LIKKENIEVTSISAVFPIELKGNDEFPSLGDFPTLSQASLRSKKSDNNKILPGNSVWGGVKR
jgi:hypothetical protein